jgi:hypothetical protein
VLAPTVAVITDLAAAVRGMGIRKGNIAWDGSRGMVEVSEQEATYSGIADWPEPVTDAHSFGGLTLLASADYAENFARLFASGSPPLYAHLVLARSALEACVVSEWLSDLTVGVEERLKRALCEHLYAAMEIKRLGITDGGAARVRTWKAVASILGWDVSTPNGIRPIVDKTERPAPANGINKLLGTERPLQIGKAQWSYLSSASHVTFFALGQALTGAPNEAALVGPMVADLGTTSTAVQLQAWCVLRALRVAASARFELMGWDDDEWLDICRQVDEHQVWLFETVKLALGQRDTGQGTA